MPRAPRNHLCSQAHTQRRLAEAEATFQQGQLVRDEGVLFAFVHTHIAAEHDHEVGLDAIEAVGRRIQVPDLVPELAQNGFEVAEVRDLLVPDGDREHGQSAALITIASVGGFPAVGGR